MKFKTALFYFLFGIVACDSMDTKKQNAIAGKFVNQSQSEFSKANDTIQVIPFNVDANVYKVVRKTSYQRIRNGNVGPYQHSSESMMAEYNDRNALLTDKKRGRVYSYASNGNELMIGSSIYKRIE